MKKYFILVFLVQIAKAELKDVTTPPIGAQASSVPEKTDEKSQGLAVQYQKKKKRVPVKKDITGRDDPMIPKTQADKVLQTNGSRE